MNGASPLPSTQGTNAGDKKNLNMKQQWKKLSGQKILTPIEDEVKNVILKESALGHQLKVCIGTDSQATNKNIVFATVIVFIRKGKGGFMYINKESTQQKMSIKQRMLFEVSKSIEVAYGLCKIFTMYNVDMEVHADINTNPGFKSNDALKEAMGYIMGMGFDFKAKPEAFASSNCADKMVKPRGYVKLNEDLKPKKLTAVAEKF